MTFFSIIATDYEGTVSPEILQRFVDSLKKQTFKDFEVLIMHDGKRSGDLSIIDTRELNIQFFDSIFRGNSWGHNLRSYGMSKAQGMFFINTNTDNIYYPNALEDLYRCIIEHSGTKVFINHVKMMGMFYKEEKIPLGKDISGNDKFFIRRSVCYDKPRDYSKSYVLTGEPPVFGNIDLMSLVAHRDIWESVYWWYDISEASDASIYSRICSLYSYHYTNILLGEHY